MRASLSDSWLACLAPLDVLVGGEAYVRPFNPSMARQIFET
jgi:hypothetical protein